jgi:diacylglycerol kinase (CTP)
MMQTLREKSDLHLARKLWHCVTIGGVAAFYNVFGAKAAWIGSLAFGAVFITIDILRQSQPRLNRFTVRVMGPVMRQHEIKSLSGATYFLLACYVLLLFNERHVVTLTLLFLAFGDPVASYFGIRFGKDKILGNKTLQGTLAAFAVCTFISLIYYYFNNLMTERLLIVAPLSGLIGAAAELVPIGKLDDNFTFPVVGAALLWMLFKVYGGFGL